MASKAPLALAFMLFALGVAGLAYTVRGTPDPAAAGDPLLVAALPRPAAVPWVPEELSVAEPAIVVAAEPVPASSPPAAPEAAVSIVRDDPQPSPEEPSATVAPPSAAIAAAVASDGTEAVTSPTPSVTPVGSVRIGQVGRDAD